MTLDLYGAADVPADLSATAARELTDQIKVAVEATWHLIIDAYRGRAWSALGYASWDDYCTREFGASRLRLPREERQEVVASLRESGLSVRAIAAATGGSVGTVHAALAGVQNRTPADDVDDSVVVDVEVVEDEIAEGEVVLAGADDREPPAPSAAPTPGPDPRPSTAAGTPRPAPAPSPAPKVTGIDGKQYPSKPPTPAKPNRRPLIKDIETAVWNLRKATERMERLFNDDRLAANKTQVAAATRGHLTYTVEVCQDLLDQLIQRKESE